ncbi:MAG TPA: hypothetical protein DCS83_06485 [Prevotella sp.]|jgi:hypothetical protein|nr:hypothetical protein [Prevotella sp.]
MKYLLLLLFIFIVRYSSAQILEKNPISLSIEGCSDSYDTWSIIPSFMYKPFHFLSLSVGLRFSDFWNQSNNSFSGDAGEHLWRITDKSDFSYHIAFQPEIKFYTPDITIDNDGDAVLFSLGMGEIMPFPKRGKGYVDFLKKIGNTAIFDYQKFVKNTGNNKKAYTFADVTGYIKSDIWSLGLGYRVTHYDIYGCSRKLFINGQKVNFPRKANNTEVYIVINYCFTNKKS